MINGRMWKYLLVNFDIPTVKTNRDLVVIIRDLLLRIAEIMPNNKNYKYKEKLTKTEIQNAWDVLIQPNGKTFEHTGKEQDLTWPGLTMSHQNSHLSEKEIEKLKKIGGVDFEKYYCNDKVDKFCNSVLN